MMMSASHRAGHYQESCDCGIIGHRYSCNKLPRKHNPLVTRNFTQLSALNHRSLTLDVQAFTNAIYRERNYTYVYKRVDHSSIIGLFNAIFSFVIVVLGTRRLQPLCAETKSNASLLGERVFAELQGDNTDVAFAPAVFCLDNPSS